MAPNSASFSRVRRWGSKRKRCFQRSHSSDAVSRVIREKRDLSHPNCTSMSTKREIKFPYADAVWEAESDGTYWHGLLESIEQSHISSEPVANAQGTLRYLHYIYITLLYGHRNEKRGPGNKYGDMNYGSIAINGALEFRDGGGKVGRKEEAKR
ncbi:hypothetical protein B0H19DRAFT_1065508 [Mycena capillaripes]|nr:hypothetical protein B0H19DRAFT_1065508 [Mycena capillaripes]